MGAVNLDQRKNAVLGELDSLNSLIGLAKSRLKGRKIKNILTDIQNDIFVIQANVANPGNVLSVPQNIGLNRIISIEKQIYLIERNLKSLNHFIIPEGSTDACLLHCLRTAARQAERNIPGYLKKPTIPAQYLDRVAGLMFALARYVNKKQKFSEQPPRYFVNPAAGGGVKQQKPDSNDLTNKKEEQVNKETKNQEKASSVLQRHIGRIIARAESDEFARAERVRTEEARAERAAVTYDKWLKKYEPDRKEAAVTIWDWYEEFKETDDFKKLLEALWKFCVSDIIISEIIVCHVPDYGIVQQSLFVNAQGLFVRNNVKYGKTYLIEKREELRRYVWPPVLIQIAETIKDGSIWEIITSDLNFR